MLTFKILVYHSKHKIIHNAMKTIHLKIYIQNPNLKKKKIKKKWKKKKKKSTRVILGRYPSATTITPSVHGAQVNQGENRTRDLLFHISFHLHSTCQ
jgi:hypothetical protein